MPNPAAKPFRPYTQYDRQTKTLRIVWEAGELSAESVPGNHLLTLLKSQSGKVGGVEIWEANQVVK